MSNKKQIQKAKEPIKIRFKKLANGNQSIYLDYYQNGKREYDFLKLYLIPVTNPFDKEKNKQTLQFAEAVKSKRVVELQNTAHGFKSIITQSKAHIIEYIQKLTNEKLKTANGNRRGNFQNYMALILHVKHYSGEKTTFKQIDKNYCLGFIEYLNNVLSVNYNKPLSKTTIYGYVKHYCIVLNRAVTDEIIQANPFNFIKKEKQPKREKPNREFLTIDEVKKLYETPCTNDEVKNVFLFCCYTGLRFSDVRALKWGQIQHDNGGEFVIRFKQKKTEKNEYLQMANAAAQFLPKRRNDNDVIFSIPVNGYTNQIIKGWVLASGINKRVTFHVARHTNATLLLSLGVPIETVSKLLGHSDIQTTQIYAKVIDKSKRDAVSKLDNLF